MIAVDRARLDEDGVAIRPPGDWEERACEATTTALSEGEGHHANAAVYSHDAVREALADLFHGKCAYCGIDVSGATWDVEHFRPKGRVRERPDHPGYYWLAYKWSNLYPACVYCNQHRLDKPTRSDPTPAVAAGKHDQFPLGDESTRAMKPGDDLSTEDRLLIDPCEDNPEEYLGYAPDGQVFSIGGALKGEKSIVVYALRRRRLAARRRQVWGETLELLKLLRFAENDGNGEAVSIVRRMLNERAEQGEHAGVVRFVERNREALLE